jgi:hypothetical protein
VTDLPLGDGYFASRPTPAQHPDYGQQAAPLAAAYGQPSAPYGQPGASYGQPDVSYGQPGALESQLLNHFGLPQQAGHLPPDFAGPGGFPPKHGGPAIEQRGGIPELVAVAYTLLAVFVTCGLFIGIAALAVQSDIGIISSSATFYEFIYGGSGVLGAVLVFALRSGAKGAQVGATALSAAWTLYWAYAAAQVASASSGLANSFVPMTGGVGVLAMLTVVCSSALVGALLWTPSAKRHFG